MKTNEFRFASLQILTGTAVAVAAICLSYGQPAPPRTKPLPLPLPAFSVKSTAADQYQAADEMSASRLAGNILDTTTTVSIITPALNRDIGPDTIFNVTRYFTGVSPIRGEAIIDRQDFRGSESFSKTIDNLSGFMIPTSCYGF